MMNKLLTVAVPGLLALSELVTPSARATTVRFTVK